MNVYKPRYKVAFQSKNKIWPYKDSRLRRFFNIRGRKLVRRGFFKRHVIVFNNMKWTIARRYIRPYMRRRKAVRRRYKTGFYTKQQLRAFHGKIKEEKFRNFFKKYLKEGVKRNTSFFASLEKRLDVFFFRLRLLPTIFACHQYILHHGVLINDGLRTSPSDMIRPGDTLSILPQHWQPLYSYLEERIQYRVHGKERLLRRKYKRLRKKTWWTRSIIKGKHLIFSIWLKRRYLDLFILNRKIMVKSLFTRLYRILNVLKNGENHNNFSVFYQRLHQIQLKFQKFIALEQMRRKFFYLQWLKLKNKFKKLTQMTKKRRLSGDKNSELSILFKTKHKDLYVHFIYILKSISSTYLNWLSLLLQIRLEEIRFYFHLLISIKGNKFKDKLNLKVLIKRWKTFLFLQAAYIKQYIILYYQAFFRKFFRIETRKSYRKLISVKLPKENKIVTKSVASRNFLTSFLIRRRLRIRRKNKIIRLKAVHWAIPNYIHFDFRTLRAVFLYSPRAKEINYSFKCSLMKIVSFYKALAL